eukprot:3244732-Amphidinium_carterae.2
MATTANESLDGNLELAQYVCDFAVSMQGAQRKAAHLPPGKEQHSQSLVGEEHFVQCVEFVSLALFWSPNHVFTLPSKTSCRRQPASMLVCSIGAGSEQRQRSSLCVATLTEVAVHAHLLISL